MRLLNILVLMLVGALSMQAARGEVTTERLVRQVRDAETAFAKTMADRDLKAFATFVAEDAVFFGQTSAMRGQAQVIEAWKKFYVDADAPFSWKPQTVEVLSSGTLAHSSGPVFDPKGKQIGTFNSIWRREADGNWKIVFDKGCDVCECK